jgi:hypothetical protein
MAFVQELVTDYCHRRLSFPTDKVIAFSSLAKRMEKVLRTEERYGIFDCFLPRLLLWKRLDRKLAPIEYKDPVPSWSWMAYDGCIGFLAEPELTLLFPRSTELSFDTHYCRLNIKIRAFENCRLDKDLENGKCRVFANKTEVGSLWFDKDAEDQIKSLKCVVVATRKHDDYGDPDKKYYVLVVRARRLEGKYERLGVGQIQAHYVSKNYIPGKLL